MKKLYLMRHGQTYFNTIGKTQGWCDSPLTDQGIQDAKKSREYFIKQGISFDAGYCSNLGRARDSLEIVAKDYIENTQALRDLRELGFGRFEGESKDILPARPYGESLVPYGGESEEAGVARFTQALIEIMEKEENQTVLAISHGSIIRAFARSFQRYSDLFPQDLLGNGSFLEYEYKNGIFYLRDHVMPL